MLKALDKVVTADSVAVITMPIKPIALDQFIDSVPLDFGFVWSPPGGDASYAGVGAAYSIRLDGRRRLEQLREQVQALFSSMVVCSFPGCAPESPRVFGGLAFSADVNSQEPWGAFGDGSFTLPRWCVGRRGQATRISLALRAEGPRWREQALEEFHLIMDWAESDPTVPFPVTERPIAKDRVRNVDRDDWQAHIEAILAAIETGAFEKIVAARRCELSTDEVLDDVQVLARLAKEYPNCYRFLFRRNESSFLGASPERLFTKRGPQLVTQALAGSMSIGVLDEPTNVDRAHVLLNSKKDRAEHAVVVREIVGGLTPLTVEIDAASTPSLLKLRNIMHLNTPIRAVLRPSTHVLHVLGALHPTPAVGGVPRWDAVRWIVEHEPWPRGWYSGPIGWLDAMGDGEFVVALRCGVIDGTRAYAFAGAGVVHGSKPELEYEETALKQQPFLRALGVQI